jgi:hypothetical protein
MCRSGEGLVGDPRSENNNPEHRRLKVTKITLQDGRASNSIIG